MAQQVMSQTGKMPTEVAAGTEHDPLNVAPIVVYLASDEAANISGQCFAASGYQIALVSQPQIIKTIRNENGWSVDSLAEFVPQTFGVGLKAPRSREDGGIDQVGLNMHRDDIPDNSWKDLGNQTEFWGIDLPPYGETR